MDLCCSSTGRLIAHQCSFEETVKLSPMIEEVHLKQGYYFKSGGSILPSFYIFLICQILGVSNITIVFLFCSKTKLKAIRRIETRVGHAYAEYANDADYAHMRNMRMRIENLIHIFHIQREKTNLFKRQ